MKSMKKKNYSTLNGFGLAIFSNFYLYWFFSNLPFFEWDPHVDLPEAIRVNSEALNYTVYDLKRW
jgi:hypothetical protein